MLHCISSTLFIMLKVISITIVASASDHPEKALKTNEVIGFQIEPKKKIPKDRSKPLRSQHYCKVQFNEYFVKKEVHIDETDSQSFYLFAASDRNFENPDANWDPNTLYLFPIHRRYSSQIALASYKPGWLDQVIVDPSEAKGCGIATVLIELVMLEYELNKVTNTNRGLIEIKKEVKESDKGSMIYIRGAKYHYDFVVQKCSHLLGLLNVAKPHAGALAYISAADNIRYMGFIVQLYDKKEAKCANNFRSYATVSLYTLYNRDTGQIEDEAEDNNEGTGADANWYFCKFDMSHRWAFS